jgi:Na+/melibiose symporter-like transporter
VISATAASSSIVSFSSPNRHPSVPRSLSSSAAAEAEAEAEKKSCKTLKSYCCCRSISPFLPLLLHSFTISIACSLAGSSAKNFPTDNKNNTTICCSALFLLLRAFSLLRPLIFLFATTATTTTRLQKQASQTSCCCSCRCKASELEKQTRKEAEEEES